MKGSGFGNAARAMVLALVATGAASGCAYPVFVHRTEECSLGGPASGYLLNAARIPDRGNGYELFRTPSQGGRAWGTSRLIHAVQHAAAAVRAHVPGGAPLRVGDMSQETGGRVTRHHSHRNGRDVDLIFYAVDSAGRSIPAPTFVRYDGTGMSCDAEHPGQAFDVARNWWLVESLARDEDAGVVRIFCSDPLKGLLLNYGRQRGRSHEVLARVEALLAQPGDSEAHDDHFHVRVACTPLERSLGCRDGAPLWWWLEKDWAKADAPALDDDALLASLQDLPPEPSVDPAPAIAEVQVMPTTTAFDGGVTAPMADTAEIVAPFAPTLARLRAPLGFHAIRMFDAHVWNALGDAPVCRDEPTACPACSVASVCEPEGD